MKIPKGGLHNVNQSSQANINDSWSVLATDENNAVLIAVDKCGTKKTVGDTSNLVPYTGATQDVNIASNYFETSQGFKKTGGTSSQYLMADGSVSTLTNPITGTGLIEVTYNELILLRDNNQLISGQNYLLTDYMTTYEQPVTGLMKSSGVIEPLILTAVSENQISNICRSTLYPQDIVYYEITGDIGNYYGTEGFTKGKIYRRIDTLRNNDIGTDWRHIKYDRDGIDKLLFEDYNYCYNNVIKTYYLFNNVIGNGFDSNTIGNNFNNNTIGNGFDSNTIWNGFDSNTIWDNFQNNTIGDNFNSNTIGNSFYSNTIGNGFYSNTIGNGFDSNTIGNNFQSNTIGNFFQSNTIGDNFQNNTIGDNFQSNTIGDNFYSNTIGNNFNNNTIGDNFYSNGTTLNPFNSENTEFRNSINNVTSSTEIQNANIDVVVFKLPNGTLKQRYYNDSNNLVINNL